MNVFELASVRKFYGQRAALDGVDLALPEGATLGLLGPNGAGKTTTLRLLLGMARASEGRVRLNGLDPLDPEARRGLGYLPERLELPAHMALSDFLALHARLAGVHEARIAGEVARVVELTGLGKRHHDALGDFSKGLAQRAGFAQALLGAPRVLLLDEPNSGLDPIGIREARDWIQAERERGCSILISSHVLSEIERLCDRVAILNEGRVAAQGPIDEVVMEGEGLEDAFVRLVRGRA